MYSVQRGLLVKWCSWCLCTKNHWVPGLWRASGHHSHSYLCVWSSSHHCRHGEICTWKSTVPPKDAIRLLVEDVMELKCSVLPCPDSVYHAHWHPSGEGQWCSVEFHTAPFTGGNLPLLHRLPRRASEMELHDQPSGPGPGLCSLPLLHDG